MCLRGRGLASFRPGGNENFEAVDGHFHDPCGPDGLCIIGGSPGQLDHGGLHEPILRIPEELLNLAQPVRGRGKLQEDHVTEADVSGLTSQSPDIERGLEHLEDIWEGRKSGKMQKNT